MSKKFDSKALNFALNLCKWTKLMPIHVGPSQFSYERSSCEWCNDENDGHFEIKIGMNDMICIDHTLGHEYGHAVFCTVFRRCGTYPNCKAIQKKCSKLKSAKKVSKYLDKMCKRYKLDCREIAPISDIMGLYLNKSIPYYLGHGAGYASLYTDYYGHDKENHIYEDEWFAGICGLAYEGNLDALRAIHKMFPVAVKHCFNIMDKAMEIAGKGKLKFP